MKQKRPSPCFGISRTGGKWPTRCFNTSGRSFWNGRKANKTGTPPTVFDTVGGVPIFPVSHLRMYGPVSSDAVTYAYGLAVPQFVQKLVSFTWPQLGQVHSAESSGLAAPHSPQNLPVLPSEPRFEQTQLSATAMSV